MSYKNTSGVAEGLLDAKLNSGRDFLDYDPVGLPDAKDVANIRTIIRNHEKAHPGEISIYVAQAKRDRDENALNPFFQGHVNKDNSRRRVLTMPLPLMREIEEAYPLMFSNRQHLAWFKKYFSGFDSSGK